MPIQIPLPDIDTKIFFVDSAGTPVAEDEVVALETLLLEAGKNLDLTKADHRILWMENYGKLLSKRLNRPISMSIASFVSKEVMERIRELKKTFAPKPTLPSSTESTPPNSTLPDASSTTKTSPDSPPFENSENVESPPPSLPTAPTT